MIGLFKTLFCSMKMAFLLVGLYATACAIATFIEKIQGTLSAKVWVYDALWFDALHLWLLLCLIGCFVTSKAWQRKKYASLFLHSSFIVIIIGAGITRYYGFEGIMSLREGQSANFITSSDHRIFIQAKNPEGQSEYIALKTAIDDSINKPINKHLSFFGHSLIFQTSKVDSENTLFKLDAKMEFLGSPREFVIIRDGDSAPNRENITTLEIEGYTFMIAWGTEQIPLPFTLKLKKFELERYPGSRSPASYASEVEVLSPSNPPFDFRIFMNNVLDYQGYRFFQSSYHPDEKGTILSVNNDPGKIPTYIGYGMLILGVLWILFDKNGRFVALGRFLKNQKFLAFLVCVALSQGDIYALSQTPDDSQSKATQTPTESPQLLDIPQLIESLKDSTPLAQSFDTLLVQDFGGRIKPLHTLTNEYIHKITQKQSWLGLSPTQVFLGMTFYPQEWQRVQMIPIKTPKIKEILGLNEDRKYIAYIDVFTKDGQYILQNYVEEANLKDPTHRNAFDKELLNIDAKINYAFLIYIGQALRIFPQNGDTQWLYPLEAINVSIQSNNIDSAKQLIKTYRHLVQGMQAGIDSHKWDEAQEAIESIRAYQNQNGGALLISPAKIKTEIFLDTYNPFFQLIYPYLLLSLVLFIIVLVGILKNQSLRPLIHKAFYLLLLALFVIHSFALILRWYVGDHAPWSNAYESMLYIAWASMLAGVICFRRSSLALCASSFLSGITLFVAHLGSMDPQIGNLVPVLKSYWLNIHVSVITASYGFLGLCFMLGVITLILFAIRSQSKPHIDGSILSVSALNEMSMILGLALLTIGNFLGGIWANESWGRYWGWDSKETWALISIAVYAIILHLRFMLKANLPFVFASASVIGFFSILMTYFGVNFYLAGMHSYASGEAFPVPLWVKLLVLGIFILIGLASRKRALDMPKL